MVQDNLNTPQSQHILHSSAHPWLQLWYYLSQKVTLSKSVTVCATLHMPGTAHPLTSFVCFTGNYGPPIAQYNMWVVGLKTARSGDRTLAKTLARLTMSAHPCSGCAAVRGFRWFTPHPRVTKLRLWQPIRSGGYSSAVRYPVMREWQHMQRQFHLLRKSLPTPQKTFPYHR